jgi:conjugative relaxase-like TrwC/TraI family protein
VVLSIGKVGAGNGDPSYYLDTVATGREDYYTGSGEAPGTWAGRGSAARGLSGRVADGDFLRVLDPGGAESKRSVLAYDLTFSAPKSVSVLFGIGDMQMSRAVRDAHDAAVLDALGYMEREACWTRRGRNGVRILRGDGLTAALFRHRSSRAGDPQLHTHAVIANRIAAEGRETALDGRALFAHAKTASYLYQASLRRELTDRLGLQWAPVDQGIAEVVGIDAEVREHFSRRRAEIVEQMRQCGGRTARSAQIATLETRRTKDYHVPITRLCDDWRARAAELGLGLSELANLVDRDPGRDRLDPATVSDHLASPGGLTARASAFDRRDTIRAWAEAHRSGARAVEVERLADQWLERADVIRLETGRSRTVVGGARYSTEDLLRIESHLLASASTRRDAATATVPVVTVDAHLQAARHLSDEQKDLVRRVTTSGAGVEVIRAAAGTGKTRALAEARSLWEATGIRTCGCALAARAALELEQTAGIDSSTVARTLSDLDRGYELKRGSVLVVDEAGMVSTRVLAKLADHAEATDSKLLLVGDDRQLPEIEAGGGFRALADRLGSIELREIQRQRHAWDQLALGDLRAGRIDAWAANYREHGRLIAHRDAPTLRELLVDDWWAAARDGHCDAVMIAHRRSDVRDLNAAGRARMRRDGMLGDIDLEAGDTAFAVGDRVVARRNDHRAGILNGSRGEITELDPKARTAKLRTIAGDELEIGPAYLDDGHLEHAYAITGHAAQGATVDRAFVLGGDDLYREWGYTAMTRHREAATFYIVSPGSVARALPGLEKEPDELLQDVRGALTHSRRNAAALAIAEDADRGREVRERLDRWERERSATKFWQRTRRADLDDLIARQREVLERWVAVPRPESPSVPHALTDDRQAIAATILDPPPATEQRIGPRPSAIGDREKWMRAAARLARSAQHALELEPTGPERTMDHDTGLEL